MATESAEETAAAKSQETTTAAATETKDGGGDKGEAKTPSAREAALEAIKVRREELAGTSATEQKKQGDADVKDQKSEAKTADDESSTEAGAETKGEKQEPRIFTGDEIAETGFFDSLDKKGWADFTKQFPAVAKAYKAAQSANDRRAKKLNDKEATLEEKAKAASAAAEVEITEEDEEELKALGFTGKDVEKLLGSKVGKQTIAKIAQQAVKSMGVDPEREQAQVSGFELALSTYPELADDDVWEAVQKEIQSDAEEAKALDEARTQKEIFRILAAATGRVVADRAKAAKSVETKEEKKREKETRNATQPVSRAVGKARVQASTTDDKAPLRTRMQDYVAEKRATSGYKELNK